MYAFGMVEWHLKWVCAFFICRVPSSTLACHPLVAAALAGLDSEDTFDAAVDGTQLL
jgi:hypothetical protein